MKRTLRFIREQIQTTSHNLMNQAPATAGFYLSRVVKEIDREFGKGYAIKNPALVATMVEVADRDFRASILASHIETGLPVLCDAIREAGRFEFDERGDRYDHWGVGNTLNKSYKDESPEESDV